MRLSARKIRDAGHVMAELILDPNDLLEGQVLWHLEDAFVARIFMRNGFRWVELHLRDCDPGQAVESQDGPGPDHLLCEYEILWQRSWDSVHSRWADDGRAPFLLWSMRLAPEPRPVRKRRPWREPARPCGNIEDRLQALLDSGEQ